MPTPRTAASSHRARTRSTSLDQLHKEIFGPVLHVVRWKADQLDAVIDAINATGYGLTLGIHSRIDETVEKIASRIKVGNCYVNRNQIGAVVGVQPFGGQNLSGTGPKAGGPHYLPRFTTEKTITVNTTAAGGNASLADAGRVMRQPVIRARPDHANEWIAKEKAPPKRGFFVTAVKRTSLRTCTAPRRRTGWRGRRIAAPGASRWTRRISTGGLSISMRW